VNPRLPLSLSLHARFLLVATATGLAALVFAAFAIGQVLENVVRQNLDEKLELQIEIIAKAIGTDSQMNQNRLAFLPGFDSEYGGWGWRVEGPKGTLQGGEPFGETRFRRHSHKREAGTDWGRGRTDNGEPVHIRRREIETAKGQVTIIAAGPHRLIERPLRAAMLPLIGSLMLLGLGLMVATWVQLRFGLGPVRLLRDAVAKVRAGEVDRLPEDVPRELQPLAEEVNALIEQNAAGLAHARRHVANLAHGLKTPLATLALRLDREGASTESRALVDQLDERIAHHLRRARSGAAAVGVRAHCNVAKVVGDLVPALERIHAERAMVVETELEPALLVAVESQDLEEMLGNILDNALQYASHRVVLSVRDEGAMAGIYVEDDGQGLQESDTLVALQPGQRLDESSPGFGFGLSIVRELAELYGGSVELSRSASLGGLLVKIILPKHLGSHQN